MNVEGLITRSLRMLRVVAASRAPTASQADTALQALQSTILTLPGCTWWKDVTISAAYVAGENERIFADAGGPWGISGPQRVSSDHTILFCCDQYAVTCCGRPDRPIKDGSRVQLLASAGVALTQMYRADTQEWVPASGLVLSSTVPVNGDMEDGLAAILAVRLVPDYGRQLDPVTAALALDTRTRMRSRYGKRQDVAAPLPVLRTSSRRMSPWSYDL